MKRGYFRREKHNLFRITLVWAAIIGICYYAYLGNKCVQHYMDMCHGHVAIITLFGE